MFSDLTFCLLEPERFGVLGEQTHTGADLESVGHGSGGGQFDERVGKMLVHFGQRAAARKRGAAARRN